MPRYYQSACLQCGKLYKGRGKTFCGKSCRMTYNNLRNNPSKNEATRLKQSLMRKGKPTRTGIPCSLETRAKISAALKGRPTGHRPSSRVIALFVEAGKKNLRHECGSSHPNWKGGITPKRQKDFRSKEYLSFVKNVLARDNYTCQNCGARDGNGYKIHLEVHHKIPYGERLDLRYDTANGITLCVACHNLTKRQKPPPSVDYLPKPHICDNCGKEFVVRNPRKYCPSCQKQICCPRCGSTNCAHALRKKLNQVASL